MMVLLRVSFCWSFVWLVAAAATATATASTPQNDPVAGTSTSTSTSTIRRLRRTEITGNYLHHLNHDGFVSSHGNENLKPWENMDTLMRPSIGSTSATQKSSLRGPSSEFGLEGAVDDLDGEELDTFLERLLHVEIRARSYLDAAVSDHDDGDDEDHDDEDHHDADDTESPTFSPVVQLPAQTTAPTTSAVDGLVIPAGTPTAPVAPVAPVSTKQPTWPFEESDIPLDPKISYGELENGFRYYYMANDEPPGQIQLRLHIDIGSNGEQDEDKGLAHYLEHMAFRATRTFPKGTDMDRQFQALGIDFGTHINAYTNFEETVYYMSMPDSTTSTIDLAFKWMRDVMDGLVLDQEELDIERDVVISELEARDSVGARLWRQTMDWMWPEHLIRLNPVIGFRETITNFTRDHFVNFYSQYYVPRRATFTVVGDNLTLAQVEELITEHFATVVDTGDRGREPDYGTVTPGPGLQAKVLLDNEQQADELYIDASRNYESIPDTIAKRTASLQIRLANSIVSRRIQNLPNEIGSNITWGGATRSIWYQTVVEPYIYVLPKEGGFWRDAVFDLEQELRRALLFGFTQAELDEVVANRLNSYEQAVASQDGRRSSGLADEINDSVNGRYVMSSPQEDLRIFELALSQDELTTETLHDAFKEYWNTTDLFLYLYTGSLEDGISEEQAAEELKQLYLESQEVELEPPEEAEELVWAYTDFGTPGTVVSDSMVEDLEIRQMILSNGVRVNMKRTDFQEDLIYIVARFGTGVAGQPKDRTYLDVFTDYMITWGGLGEYNWRDLDRVLAGKTVGTGMGVSEGAFTFSGTTNLDDVELQLQLMAAHFTDPAYGDEAVRWWVDEAPASLDEFKFTLDGAYYDAQAYLKGNDERWNAPTEEEMYAFEASDASEWLNPQLANSYLEISVVGDLEDEQAIIDVLLATFGALPAREETPPQFTAEDRAINIPQGGPQSTATFTFESKIPQAAQMVVWEIPAVIGEDIRVARQLDVLGEIFSYRVFEYVRKELGATYSPSAWTSNSQTFDYGFLQVYVEGTPEELQLFDDAIMLIATNITTEGIGEKELENTQAPFQTRIEESMRSNSYWLYNVLEESQAKPFQLDWFRERSDHYANITVDEINALAQQYLTEDKALHISILAVNGTETAAS